MEAGSAIRVLGGGVDYFQLETTKNEVSRWRKTVLDAILTRNSSLTVR